MARVKAANYEDRLTIVEHLDELRSRLIFCGVALVIVTGLCFWQNHLLLDIANAPLPDDTEPLTFSPSEPFLTTLTLTLYGAILLTMPILLYQAYAYVLPALTPREKKVAVPMLLMVPVLFIAGVVFAYFVVLPGGDQVPPELQRRPVQHPDPRPRVLQLLLAARCSRSGSCSRSRSASSP